MKLDDFRRLKKFMALTTSDNDNEALQALRQANKVLSAHGLTWPAILDKTVTVKNEMEQMPIEPSAQREGERIDKAFQTALDRIPRGTFRDFILSLEKQWHETRHLSPAQRDAVIRAAQR